MKKLSLFFLLLNTGLSASQTSEKIDESISITELPIPQTYRNDQQAFDAQLTKLLAHKEGCPVCVESRGKYVCCNLLTSFEYVKRIWDANNMAENNKHFFPRSYPYPRDNIFTKFVRIYAELGADINHIENNNTPLMAWVSVEPFSAQWGITGDYSSRLKHTELLLQCGADQNIVVNNNYALKIAVNIKDHFLVALLLRYSPNKNLLLSAFIEAIMQWVTYLSTSEPEKTIILQQLSIYQLFVNNIKKRDDYQKSDFQDALELVRTNGFKYVENLLSAAMNS